MAASITLKMLVVVENCCGKRLKRGFDNKSKKGAKLAKLEL